MLVPEVVPAVLLPERTCTWPAWEVIRLAQDVVVNVLQQLSLALVQQGLVELLVELNVHVLVLSESEEAMMISGVVVSVELIQSSAAHGFSHFRHWASC